MDATQIAASELGSAARGDADLDVLELTDESFDALSEVSSARVVALAANSLSAKNFDRLLALRLPRLRRLKLLYSVDGPARMAALGASALAEQVHHLIFVGPTGGGESTQKLVGGPLFPRLQALELLDGDAGDASCEVLAAAAAKAHLRALSFGRHNFGLPGGASNSEVTCAGVRALVGAAPLQALERLDVALTGIDAALSSALIGSPLARFVYLFPGLIAARRAAPKGAASFEFRGAKLAVDGAPEGPYTGTIVTSDGQRIDGCGPGGVYSDDGTSLAIPVWDRGHSFVRVLSPGRSTDLSRRTRGSLALYSFDGRRARGIASLEESPAPFEVGLA